MTRVRSWRTRRKQSGSPTPSCSVRGPKLSFKPYLNRLQLETEDLKRPRIAAGGTDTPPDPAPFSPIPTRALASLKGTIVLANDPVAADATCARLMGFEPNRVVHIREGSRFLGSSSPGLLDQAGEAITAPTTPFQVVPEFQHLHAL